ncbi:MAG: 4'-phosphopantetheinyl transferase superfamily protein [Balneolaceae bacterium]|nr:4'-phosphopantetheinyl transferase superfamily protein [Balneolaceae bacterium]
MKKLNPDFESILPNGITVTVDTISDAHTSEWLNPEERTEFDQLTSEQRKNEFLSSRKLLGETIAAIGLDDDSFRLKKDSYGKPYGVSENRTFHVSIAHSRTCVVCGISGSHDIGIDIEPLARQVSERVRERIRHPQEHETLQTEPLIRLWTLKEALVKLEGRGLRTNLNRIRLHKHGRHTFSGIFDDEKSARICSFTYGNHWIAVAFYHQNN